MEHCRFAATVSKGLQPWPKLIPLQWWVCLILGGMSALSQWLVVGRYFMIFLSKCVWASVFTLSQSYLRCMKNVRTCTPYWIWVCLLENVCVCALTTAVCLDSSAILRPRLSRWRKLKARRISWRRQGGLKRSKSPEQSQHMDAYGTLYIRRKFSETSPSYGRMRMVSFHIMSTTEVARVCKSNFCSWEVDTAVSENIRSQ